MTKRVAFLAKIAIAVLAPGSLDCAAANLIAQQKVTVATHQTASFCDGGRGSVVVKDHTLAFVGERMTYPWWEVKLEQDGSANKTVGEYIPPNRLIRVKVAAGTGPREITSVSERSLCGFR